MLKCLCRSVAELPNLKHFPPCRISAPTESFDLRDNQSTWFRHTASTTLEMHSANVTCVLSNRKILEMHSANYDSRCSRNPTADGTAELRFTGAVPRFCVRWRQRTTANHITTQWLDAFWVCLRALNMTSFVFNTTCVYFFSLTRARGISSCRFSTQKK